MRPKDDPFDDSYWPDYVSLSHVVANMRHQMRKRDIPGYVRWSRPSRDVNALRVYGVPRQDHQLIRTMAREHQRGFSPKFRLVFVEE